MKKIFLIVCAFVVVLSQWGCKKEEAEEPGPEPFVMEGRWVEIQDKTDTIEFLSLEPNSRIFELSRGREVQNGTSVPKAMSGIYNYYWTKADSITVRWLFSSNASTSNHYFKREGDELWIGDFYGKNSSAISILTFRRIK